MPASPTSNPPCSDAPRPAFKAVAEEPVSPLNFVRGLDPRLPFAALLALYAALGCTVLRFNRGPWQMLLTVAGCCVLDMVLHRILRGRWIVPLSACISGLSLALLLNYSHNDYLLFLPVFLTIGSKYLFTFRGRHHFNPSLFGVAGSLLIGGDLITTAPAYQWGGTLAMSLFLVAGALSLFVFRIGRGALIGSFLVFYLAQIALRAWYMRYYLPPEALLFGTLTSAPFFLFVFYMITDPKTSPPGRRAQVATAFALVVVDLVLHRLTSLYTFFYAGFIVATARFAWLHARRIWGEKDTLSRLWHGPTLRTSGVLAGIAVPMLATYHWFLHPAAVLPALPFAFVEVPPAVSGLAVTPNPAVFEQIDPRVRHIAKWLLSAGDAAAAADFDGDGLPDIFVTHPLAAPGDRAVLYRNLGGMKFERIDVPALRALNADPITRGLPACPLFVDYDNDGDQDIFISTGYGPSVLLRNLLRQTGQPAFEDVTAALGLDEYTVSIGANWFDFDRDGRLDLFVANAFNPELPQYQPPRRLDIFHLQAPEFPGDRRMLPFMHASWDNAANGGRNALFRNSGARFEKLDAAKIGMPETHWSLAVATGDLDNDGWTDLYVANDFGPDDCYLNDHGRALRPVQGRMFGEIGRDTYKGMNASFGDLDRNGWLDIYVSNVHVPLQAEGSLLWMLYPPARQGAEPIFRDEATQRGALNEHYFGWGAAMGDLDNDGWLDLAQANGMVDDSYDRRFAKPRSYWYVNEKLMRSGPGIHTYADMWGDLRGYDINGREPNRIYLSRGGVTRMQFADTAPQLGLTAQTNSRGMLLADFDSDGALDLLVTHQFASPTLYRSTLNDRTAAPHWIGFALAGNGTTVNRDAAGARISISYVENGKRVEQMREITIANAFAAQGDRRAHFGLGAFAGEVEVNVRWPGEPARVVGTFAPGGYHRIEQTQ